MPVRPHLVIASEQRLDAGLAAKVQSDLDALGRPYSRLGNHFATTTIVARSPDVSEISGPVTVRSLPDFRGVAGMLRHGWKAYRAGRQVLRDADLLLIPVPSFATLPLWLAARATGTPWVAHVVGDAGVVPRTIGMRAAGLWGRLSAMISRRQVNGAVGAWFVTSEALQGGYEPHPVSLVASNVSITDEWFAAPRPRQPGQQCRLVFVGSLERPYKGLDVLLSALSEVGRPETWHLDVVGDGALRSQMMRLSKSLQLDGQVTWHGQVDRESVRNLLQHGHVFVMPSLTEGLPRALVEAMACGLACVGTRVGGIPELLPAEALVKPGDTSELAAAVSRLITDEEHRFAAANRCNSESRLYAKAAIDQRIDEFAAQVVASVSRR
jgi:phosphatidylinositol alpha-1,6-mannosyltransferase